MWLQQMDVMQFLIRKTSRLGLGGVMAGCLQYVTSNDRILINYSQLA